MVPTHSDFLYERAMDSLHAQIIVRTPPPRQNDALPITPASAPRMPARRQPCCGLCPKGERLIDESQDGPRSHSERFCTDAICLLPLLLTMATLAAIGQLALATGDPNSLRFGTDHLGRRCGAGPLAAAPKLFYPHLGSELLAQRELLATPWQLRLFGVCVAECPQREAGAVRELSGSSDSYAVSLSTQSVMNRCLPVEEQDTVRSVYCVEPQCHAVGAACEAVRGHSGAWLMRGDAQHAQCTRQLSLFVQETYSLPGPAEARLAPAGPHPGPNPNPNPNPIPKASPKPKPTPTPEPTPKPKPKPKPKPSPNPSQALLAHVAKAVGGAGSAVALTRTRTQTLT